MEPENYEKDKGLPEIYLSPTKKHLRKGYSAEGKTFWENSSDAAVKESSFPVSNLLNFADTTKTSRTKSYTEIDTVGNRVMDNNKYITVQSKNVKQQNIKRPNLENVVTQRERKRGETPGSDCPSNMILASGNLRINVGSTNNMNKNDEARLSAGTESSDEECQSHRAVTSVTKVDRTSFKGTSTKPDTKGFKNLSPRRAVEGADSSYKLLLTSSLDTQLDNIANTPVPDTSLTETELSMLQRNSPAGISTPETVSVTASTDTECAVSSVNAESSSARPPALGQCEETIKQPVNIESFTATNRKDLGSTDGEESESDISKNNTKIKGNRLPGKRNIFKSEACSVGSQSENTDSTSTVLDMKRGPIQGCEDSESKMLLKKSSILSKPNFLVGGPISSPIGSIEGSYTDTATKATTERFKFGVRDVSSTGNISSKNQLASNFSEKQDSLTSAISAESTHIPESSECITPPSVQSVSSIASSKKLEWDSGADVGYAGKSFEPTGILFAADSMSTLERIAIGNYAAVLRTEPEGTTNIKSKVKPPKKGTRKDFKIPKLTKLKAYKSYGNSASLDDKYNCNWKTDSSTSDLNEYSAPSKRKIKKSYHSSARILNKNPETRSLVALNSYSAKIQSIIEKTKSLSDIKMSVGQQLADDVKSLSVDQLTFQKPQHHNDVVAYTESSPILLPFSTACGFPVKNYDIGNKPISLTVSEKYGGWQPNYASESDKDIMNLSPKCVSDDTATQMQLDQSSGTLSVVSSAEKMRQCKETIEESESNFVPVPDTLSESNDSIGGQSRSTVTRNSSSSSSISIFNLSLNSVNAVLLSLSNKLKGYVDNLKNHGSFSNVSDYDKLQDYIEFVGMPSNNDEEVKLKHSIAEIIMRMFGDIYRQEGKEPSYTVTTETSQLGSNSSSWASDAYNNEPSASIARETENGDNACSQKNTLKEYFVTSAPMICVPYHPSPTTKTYFIAASRDIAGDIIPPLESPPSRPDEAAGTSALKDFDHAGSSKGVYQDRHGTFHVAHQPPGYNSYIDSHQSESTSENETNKVASDYHPHNCENDDGSNANNDSEQRRNVAPVWTSTGSESAYETIRERHRNVGEALASSFEFYSTSPRDARVLGYVNSDNDMPEAGAQQDRSEVSEASFCPRISDVAGITRTSNRSIEKEYLSSSSSQLHNFVSKRTPKKAFKKLKHHKSKSKAGNYSSLADSEGGSSSVSVIQVQRKRYVRRIRKYIHTLEKLERILMPVSFESAASHESYDRSSQEKTHESLSEESKAHDRNISIPFGETMVSYSSSEIHANSYDKSSEGVVDSSLVIHRTMSAPKIVTPESSSSTRSTVSLNLHSSVQRQLSCELYSKENSPRQTSTLRKDEEKVERLKMKEFREVRMGERELDLRNCGKFSDFRKLMASTAVPGEIRPFRYLLHKPNNTEDTADGYACESENVHLWESKRTDSIVRESLPSNRNRINDKSLAISGSLSSDSNIKTKGRDNSKESDLTSEIYYHRIGEYDQKTKDVRFVAKKSTQMTESHDTAVDSVAKKSQSKQTREFGQMFPSSTDLPTNCKDSSKLFAAVGTQTGSSLLKSPEIIFSPVATSSRDITKENVALVAEMSNSTCDQIFNKKISDPVVLSSSIISLEEMDGKIKENAARINAAIKAYNKQFGEVFVRKSQIINRKASEAHVNICDVTIDPSESVGTDPSLQLQLQQAQISTEKYEDSQDIVSDRHSISKQSVKRRDAEILKNDKEIIGMEHIVINSSQTKNGMKFVVILPDRMRNEVINRSLAAELLEVNKENEIMTLQEALALAKPRYIKEAEKRRMKIRRKQALRQELQEQNKSILADLPDNLKTPTVLRNFLHNSDDSPLFSYKAMREQNRRLYQRLPEAQKPKVFRRKVAKYKTNQLMANFYSQKLRGKALKGKVSHAHRDVVTPVR